MDAPTRIVTRLLKEAVGGRHDAWGELVPLIYGELHKIASAQMRSERADHTLEATALVHEAYLRLVEQHSVDWNSRTHFYGAAATAMRRVLVDHARRRDSVKRGGGVWQQHPLDSAVGAIEKDATNIVDLDDALNRLTTLDAQQAKIVELRFFGGLSIDETAAALGISTASVERGWRAARAWLFIQLRGQPG